MTVTAFTSDELSGIGIGPEHGAPMARLNEIIAAVNANTTQVAENTDSMVDAVIAVADASGGETAAALTADLKDLSGNALAKTGVFEIVASDTEYAGVRDANANVTFATATKGSILATGSGWAIVKADAIGQFSCTVSNSSDETVYFSCQNCSGGVDALANGVFIRGCLPDSAEWAA